MKKFRHKKWIAALALFVAGVFGFSPAGNMVSLWGPEIAWAIEKVDLEDATVTLLLEGKEATSFQYTGDAIKPDANVKVLIDAGTEQQQEIELSPDEDYTVAYGDKNTNATQNPDKPDAYVEISAKDSSLFCTGNVKKYFIITKAPSTFETEPVGKEGLFYDVKGNEQELLAEPGSSKDGYLAYCDTLNGTYKKNLPVGRDVGTYYIYYKIVGDDNHKDLDMDPNNPTPIEVKIDKIPSSMLAPPTGFTHTNETIKGKHDGTITGATDAMEFSTIPDLTSSQWEPCDGKTIKNLAPGKYYIRYAETATKYPSPATEIVISSGKAVTISGTITLSDGTIPSGEVVIEVQDENKAAVAESQISVSSSKTACTYSVTDLSLGTYTITATHTKDGISHSKSETVKATTTTVSDVDFVIERDESDVDPEEGGGEEGGGGEGGGDEGGGEGGGDEGGGEGGETIDDDIVTTTTVTKNPDGSTTVTVKILNTKTNDYSITTTTKDASGNELNVDTESRETAEDGILVTVTELHSFRETNAAGALVTTETKTESVINKLSKAESVIMTKTTTVQPPSGVTTISQCEIQNTEHKKVLITLTETVGQAVTKAVYVLKNSVKKTVRLKKVETTGSSYVIPNWFEAANGMTYYVAEIGKKTFAGNLDITAVSIGGNVQKIEEKAFQGAKWLKNIYLDASSLKRVADHAFHNIKKNAVIMIYGTKKQIRRAKNLIKKSGISSDVSLLSMN